MKVAAFPGARSPTSTWVLGSVRRFPLKVSGAEAAASSSSSRVVIGSLERKGATLMSVQLSLDSFFTIPLIVSTPRVGRVDGLSSVMVTESGVGVVASAVRTRADDAAPATASPGPVRAVTARVTTASARVASRVPLTRRCYPAGDPLPPRPGRATGDGCAHSRH